MPGPNRTPYRIKVVDSTAKPYASITDVAIDRFIWERNTWGTAGFHLPTTHPAAAECIALKREIQLWYDPPSGTPRCIWWGPIISREAQQTGQTQIQAAGLLWYLSRIQMGPVLANYLLDPDFQDPALAHWTAGGSVTKTSDTSIVRSGSRSMRLVSSAAGLDNFATQTFTFDNSAGAEDVAFFVRARFYLTATAGTPYIGPAFEERGLFVQTKEAGVVKSTVWWPIDNTAPRNQWVRIFAPVISVPAGHIYTLEVRPYSPGGTINWATSVSRIEESTGANTISTYADLNQIVANVLVYGQDGTKNKPNLHISGPGGTYGLTLPRQYQFYDHGYIWDACLKPLIDAGFCDVDIMWNSAATTRQLVLYARQGSYKGQLALSLGGNAAIYSHKEDGQQTAGAISILSNGMQGEQSIGTQEKVADDLAYAVDASANSGICFDEIVSPTPEATLDSMTSQAATELARRKNLVVMPGWAVPADIPLAGGLGVGDVIPFRGSHGWVEGPGNQRVASMQLVPSQGNTMIVTGDPDPAVVVVFLPQGTHGVAYSAALVVGGTAPYALTVTGLPAGISATSAGLITGTPAGAGTSQITVSGTDASGATVSGTVPLVVA